MKKTDKRTYGPKGISFNSTFASSPLYILNLDQHTQPTFSKSQFRQSVCSPCLPRLFQSQSRFSICVNDRRFLSFKWAERRSGFFSCPPRPILFLRRIFPSVPSSSRSKNIFLLQPRSILIPFQSSNGPGFEIRPGRRRTSILSFFSQARHFNSSALWKNGGKKPEFTSKMSTKNYRSDEEKLSCTRLVTWMGIEV